MMISIDVVVVFVDDVVICEANCINTNPKGHNENHIEKLQLQTELQDL